MSADLLFKTMTAIENLFAAPDAQAEQEAEEQLLAVRYEIRKHLVNITLDQMADNAREVGLSYEQPAPAQLPPNCGTGYCSCIECLKGKP